MSLLTNLRELRLDNTELQRDGIPPHILVGMRRLKLISAKRAPWGKHIDWSGLQLNDAVLSATAHLLPKGLEFLNISNNLLRADAMSWFKSTCDFNIASSATTEWCFPYLAAVDMSGNEISDVDSIALKFSRRARRSSVGGLRSMNLQGNSVRGTALSIHEGESLIDRPLLQILNASDIEVDLRHNRLLHSISWFEFEEFGILESISESILRITLRRKRAEKNLSPKFCVAKSQKPLHSKRERFNKDAFMRVRN